MKLILENWRQYLNENDSSPVIGHLVGQAGSGKTYFIDNTLLKKYPEIVAKDLDDFDDEADAAVASGKGDKSWRMDLPSVDQKLAQKHFDEVQNLVNQFISENSAKKIFFAGMNIFPWVQGNNELDIGNPELKAYLNVDPEVSARRRIERDVEKGLYDDQKPTQEEWESELKWAAEEKAQLLSSGYECATPEEIVKAVDGVMQGAGENRDEQ
jgi:hypothetical protein